jgi:hypothetical protein
MSVDEASMIVIDDSIVMLKIVASLTDNFRGIIYDYVMFIVQATGLGPHLIANFCLQESANRSMPRRITQPKVLLHLALTPSWEKTKCY